MAQKHKKASARSSKNVRQNSDMAFGRKKKAKAAETKSALEGATSDELFVVDLVRKIQVERLRKTYDDFFQNPEYTKIAKYFFEQIYGAGDKASRDAAFNKIYEKLSAAVNAPVSETRCVKSTLVVPDCAPEVLTVYDLATPTS